MSTTPIEIGSDRWNAQVYRGLWAASELAAEIDESSRDAVSMSEPENTSQLLDDLNAFLGMVLVIIDRYESLPLSTVSSNDRYVSARDSALKLYEIGQRLLSMESEYDVFDKLKEKMNLLRITAERLLDVANWLDAKSEPDEIEEKILSALDEFARGETVPLFALR